MTGSTGAALAILQSMRAECGTDDVLYWLMSAVISRQIGSNAEGIQKDVDYAMRALKRETKTEDA